MKPKRNYLMWFWLFWLSIGGVCLLFIIAWAVLSAFGLVDDRSHISFISGIGMSVWIGTTWVFFGIDKLGRFLGLWGRYKPSARLNDAPEFDINPSQEPSFLRRLLYRTAYLKLQDGEFFLWCYETGEACRCEADCLNHPRVVVSDLGDFAHKLFDAMRAVCRPGRRHRCTIVIHFVRSLDNDLTSAERYLLVAAGKAIGFTRLFTLWVGNRQVSPSQIINICRALGGFREQWRSIKDIPLEKWVAQSEKDTHRFLVRVNA